MNSLIKNLTNLTLKHISFYDIKEDNPYETVVDGKPQYVNFNDSKLSYAKALENAENELFELFSSCQSYEEARETIMSHDTSNLCSKQQGYSTEPGTTGRYYGCYVVLWGNDNERSICWDVRWY